MCGMLHIHVWICAGSVGGRVSVCLSCLGNGKDVCVTSIFLLKISDGLHLQHFQKEYHVSSSLFDINRSCKYLQNVCLYLAQVSLSYSFVFILHYLDFFLESLIKGNNLKILK